MHICCEAGLVRSAGLEPSEHAVDTTGCSAAVVQALRPDALAAGVVEPTVLGSAHGFAVLLALVDGQAVVKEHHSTQVIWLWSWRWKGGGRMKRGLGYGEGDTAKETDKQETDMSKTNTGRCWRGKLKEN